MRKGGGKDKGAEWERQVGKALSLWLTNQERKDIFSRNVLSGGSFTIAQSAGKQSSRMPGDLMAAHPLAFKFLSAFMVECKHLASLGLENYLFDVGGASPLAQIVSFAAGQAQQAKLRYIIIAKQNFREPLVFTSAHVGLQVLSAFHMSSTRVRVTPMHHMLHRQHVYVMRFIDLVRSINPEHLLQCLDPL